MSKTSKRAARLKRKKAKQLQLQKKEVLRKPKDYILPAMPPEETKQPMPIRQLLLKKRLKGSAAFLLAVATLSALLIAVWPHVRAVAPVDLADPLQPYGVPFSIQNSGNLPIYNAEVQCVPHELDSIVLRSADKAPGPAIGNRRFVADEIPSGETKPFTCDVFRMPRNPIISTTYADIGILVRFRLIRFIPLNWPVKSQVFITSPESNGKLRWREYIPPLKIAPPKYPAK